MLFTYNFGFIILKRTAMYSPFKVLLRYFTTRCSLVVGLIMLSCLKFLMRKKYEGTPLWKYYWYNFFCLCTEGFYLGWALRLCDCF